MAKPPLLVVFGDTHFGSDVAICPESFITDAGKEMRPSPGQEWLLAQWRKAWHRVNEARKGRKLVVVHIGDVCEGVHHSGAEGMAKIADHENMAFEMLEPIRHMANEFHILRGTEVHAGGGHTSEVSVGKRLGADSVEFEMQLYVGDSLHDFAHHGRTGARPWNSAAAAQAAEVIFRCAETNPPSPIPRFVWRGHRHLIDDSGDKFASCRCITTPAWQLRTSHGYKVAPNRLADIGIVLVDGDDVRILRYVAPRREARRACP